MKAVARKRLFVDDDDDDDDYKRTKSKNNLYSLRPKSRKRELDKKCM
jgi:hypothetical protein